MPDNIEYGKASATDVLIDPDPNAKVFCYINDLTTIDFFDKSWERLNHAVSFAMNIFGRTVHEEEPLPRDHIVPVKKLSAEGGLEEMNIILGWIFAFITLTGFLTKDKHKAWSEQVRTLIINEASTMDELNSMIGRLG